MRVYYFYVNGKPRLQVWAVDIEAAVKTAAVHFEALEELARAREE